MKHFLQLSILASSLFFGQERDTIENSIEEVVISGTMKEVKKLESPIPVEVYSPTFFKKNPTPSLFDALQNINGVRPQLNCNICNTGDIHINGLEGPYTLVMIDGMPMVSSLGSVYGLSGIPNSLVERIEIIKGPASSLYGSEAIGGLINVITKKPNAKTSFSSDFMSTSWGEYNIDLGLNIRVNEKISSLTGINYFNFQSKIDNNKDNFTDVTLQDRISIFQKFNFKRKSKKTLSIAARYMYEDRWGGDLRWNKSYRGGDEIYGESIYTNRSEVFGAYQLPIDEKIYVSFSYIQHLQDSRYGTTSYIGDQKIAFTQLIWDKKISKHDLLAGAAFRYSRYDDNTPATESPNLITNPEIVKLPGIFLQDEISMSESQKILLGARYDYHNHHGSIFTPRIAYQWKWNDTSTFRINSGTGFRVVNLFTEDHAALTGAREVIITGKLLPEKSYNINLNYVKKYYLDSGTTLGFDVSAFYTYFTNRIVPDYTTSNNQIIYENINGNTISKGINLNTDFSFANGLKLILGATAIENTIKNNGKTEIPMLTENFTGTWIVSYTIPKIFLTIDYTGNIFSPMRLPLAGELDPRSSKSPWWSLQNIQFTYNAFKNIEVYLGVKNLLNWTPNKGIPFLIARSHDPFDKNVSFDSNGKPLSTNENPYALTFDPSYMYAPNQGIRGFLGLRIKL